MIHFFFTVLNLKFLSYDLEKETNLSVLIRLLYF